MVRRDRVRRPRRKVCQCCVDHIDTVDYKDVAALRRFVSERGKILPRRVTGTCAKHQSKSYRTASIQRRLIKIIKAPGIDYLWSFLYALI